MSVARDTQAGFTLIETLVALTVLAVGSVTLLTGVERHASSTRGLSDRVVAKWVAENALAAATLGVPMEGRWFEAMGINWVVRQEARTLPGTGLHAVSVRVADAAAGPDASLVMLTGYLALGEVAQ